MSNYQTQIQRDIKLEREKKESNKNQIKRDIKALEKKQLNIKNKVQLDQQKLQTKQCVNANLKTSFDLVPNDFDLSISHNHHSVEGLCWAGLGALEGAVISSNIGGMGLVGSFGGISLGTGIMIGMGSIIGAGVIEVLKQLRQEMLMLLVLLE